MILIDSRENKSRLMKEFRSKPAYVLLGDPGRRQDHGLRSRESGNSARTPY